MESQKTKKKMPKSEKAIIGVISVLCAVIFAGGLFFALRHVINEAYNLAYRREYYFDRSATTHMHPLKPEGWVPYYNTGNNDFQNGRYQSAVDNYMMALEEIPPHEETTYTQEGEDAECEIRINLALSMLHMIDFENLHINDREEVDRVVAALLEARGILTAEDCAHLDDPNGHNADAEQLKKEIDEILMRLNRKPPTGGGGGEEDNPSQSPSEGEEEDDLTRRERELEQRLNDEMSDAREEQMESQRRRERESAGDGYGGYGNPEVQSW
ncbi:MAG: hypothetical protein IJQ12_05815 [Lachnospiraceae bacterium]|nr:hypothetical protein [Lachnospiraceae bacterium]